MLQDGGVPANPSLITTLALRPALPLSLLSLPLLLSRHFHSVGPCLSYIYIEGRAGTYRRVRTTGETVGPECDATKTVDKEQGPEEGQVVHSHWKKREGRREQESSLITISLPATVHRKRPRKGSERGRREDPWQYRVRTVTRTVNVDHGCSETDIATL